MKIAALFSFILHLFFIPFILFLFSDVRTPHPHTRMIWVSLRATGFETSVHTPSAHALENPIPIEGPKLLPLGQDGEKLGEEPVTNAAPVPLALDRGLSSESKNLPSLDGSFFEEESSPAPVFESAESKEKFFFAYGSRKGSDRGDGDIGQGFGEDEGGGKGGPLWKDSGESQGSGPGRGHGGLGDGSGLGKGNPAGGGSQKGSGLWGKLFSSRGGSGGGIPRYGVNPKPSYPVEAREKGYEGDVLLRVEVLPHGRVGHIEVKRTSGYEILDQSALLTVRQWRFIPARKGGEAIPFWVNIPIKFHLH